MGTDKAKNNWEELFRLTYRQWSNLKQKLIKFLKTAGELR